MGLCLALSDWSTELRILEGQPWKIKFFGILIPASGLISGLIGAFVGLQNRALLAEVRKELAELENRIITRINGTYVRSGECRLREENCPREARNRWWKRSGTETPPACEAGGGVALLFTAPCGMRGRHRGV